MKSSPPLPTNGRRSRRPVRVCYMIDRLGVAGTESQLLALIRSLDRKQVKPYLCLLDGTSDRLRFLEPEDCPVLRLGIHSLRHPTTLYRLARFVAFLRCRRIDVLQVYFPDSTYVGVLAAQLAGVPHVVRTRNNLGYWLTPVHRRLGRLCNQLADVTVANCEACKQSLLRDERPPHNRVVVVENGIDLSRFANGQAGKARARNGIRQVGIVANLRRVKDLPCFIRAASLVLAQQNRVEFLIAGEGEERPRIERLIRELEVQDHVKLLGSVVDVPGLLRHLDLAVLCSRSEGLPNALLEYMAAGLPIVSTAVGGAAALIKHGVDGLLVPPKEPARLAEAVALLLRDQSLARRLGTAAQQRAAATYSHPARGRRFERLYRELIQHGRRFAHVAIAFGESTARPTSEPCNRPDVGKRALVPLVSPTARVLAPFAKPDHLIAETLS